MADNMIIDFDGLYKKFFLEEAYDYISSLWHYTSADGLVGIVRDEQNEHGKLHFWFTRSDCLNDTSEGKHILDLFKEVCVELLESESIDISFYNAIYNAEISNHQFVNFPTPSVEDCVHESVLDCVPCHAYICSFSLKENSLDMWRYYSKGNGGYGLNVYSSLFDEYKEYEFSDYDEKAIFSCIRSFKVIYDEELKKSKLKDIIIDTFSAYQNEKDDQRAIQFIQYRLKILQFQFKHNCYSSEEEYRFVFYLPYSKPKRLKNELPEIKYRVQNGVLVPYIDIVINNDNAYLNKVMISPFIENEYAVATTCDYLTQCGFNCKIIKSTLPVRN